MEGVEVLITYVVAGFQVAGYGEGMGGGGGYAPVEGTECLGDGICLFVDFLAMLALS